MTRERWEELMRNSSITLEDEEFDEGWHFCADWDELLIRKDMPEMECCTCEIKHEGLTISLKEYYAITNR